MAIAPTSSWGKASVILTCVLVPLTWITIVARVLVRRKIKGLGLDDYLMCFSVVIYTIDAPLLLIGYYNGVGSYDRDLSDYYQESGRRWTVISQLIYIVTIAPIKCSICVALLRITIERRFKYSLYMVMFVSVASTLVTIIVIITWCKPISAQWKPALIPTNCGSFRVITGISYFIGVCSIVTDWACAILPIFIFWNVQLRKSIRVSLVAVLSLGIFASVSTIVRFSYVLSIVNQENYLVSVAKLVVWSTTESGVGIVAGSLATLRPLLKHVPFLSYASSGARSKADRSRASTTHFTTSHKLERINNLSRAPGYKAMCTHSENTQADPSDAESQKHILKETTVIIQHKDDDEVDPADAGGKMG